MALINSLTDKSQYIPSHACAKDTEHKKTQNIKSMHGGQAWGAGESSLHLDKTRRLHDYISQPG